MADEQIIPGSFELVDIESIEPHPENPNKGDVMALADSIKGIGFYGAVLVQKSTNRILAGEHRWRGMRERGSERIPVIVHDVDDEVAMRIMMGDNQYARMAELDMARAAANLQALRGTEDGLASTGWNLTELDELLDSMEPPSLDDIIGDEVDNDRAGWPTVTVQIPPDIASLWNAHVDNHDGDATAAFTNLVTVM